MWCVSFRHDNFPVRENVLRIGFNSRQQSNTQNIRTSWGRTKQNWCRIRRFQKYKNAGLTGTTSGRVCISTKCNRTVAFISIKYSCGPRADLRHRSRNKAEFCKLVASWGPWRRTPHSFSYNVAWFHISRCTNCQNKRYRSVENHMFIHAVPLRDVKFGVVCYEYN